MVKILNKILANRIILLAMIALPLAACGSGPEKRVNEGEGPFSARARNSLATNNPTGLLRVGEGFERSGNYRGALNIYGQAMAADPDLLEAQIAYARVVGLLGAHDRSLSILTALLEKHPGNLPVRLALANANIRVGHFTVAVLLLEPLLEDADASAELLDLGGRLAQVSGNSQRARELIGRALAKNRGDHTFLQHMALSFALEGEFASAVAMLQKAMDKSAGLIPGKQSLAMVYALSGQYSAALQLARGSMTTEEAEARRFVYRNIPSWTKEQQAMAVLFNQFPKELLREESSASK